MLTLTTAISDRFFSYTQRRTQAIKILETRGRGRSQGLSKIFRAAIYMAHRAVVFAIARLSCSTNNVHNGYRTRIFLQLNAYRYTLKRFDSYITIAYVANLFNLTMLARAARCRPLCIIHKQTASAVTKIK